MTHIVVPRRIDIEKLHGRWVHCENGVWLPPPRVPVPIVVRSASGHFTHIPAALWLSGSFDIKPGDEFTMEQVLDILAQMRWCTSVGNRIPVNAFAWYVVPGFNEAELFEGDLYGKLT